MKSYGRGCGIPSWGRKQPAPKYGNVKADGYDSRRERRRAEELRLLERAGEIADLQEQVAYTLVPRQNDPATGRMVERPVRYVADFVYVDEATGETVVEDVKGYCTPEYVIKRKLMLWVHGVRVREI